MRERLRQGSRWGIKRLKDTLKEAPMSATVSLAPLYKFNGWVVNRILNP